MLPESEIQIFWTGGDYLEFQVVADGLPHASEPERVKFIWIAIVRLVEMHGI